MEMDNEQPVKVENDSKNLIVKLNLDWLLSSQETADVMPLKVTSRKRAIEWLSKYLVNLFSNEGFGCMADDMLSTAYEEGETWLQGLESFENDEKDED
jgi:hypothetical protein